MGTEQAFVSGLWLGGVIVLTLEHFVFPLSLRIATHLARRH